jgi:hypothetical protein
MARTATTIFDIIGGTQCINFNNPSLIDNISFANNQITFQTTSEFNLAQSDLLLYIKYLQTFNTLLFNNFPTLKSYLTESLPLCNFQITETNVGVVKITYIQTSLSSLVYTINYLPIATSAAFSARNSVMINIQEFNLLIAMLQQYANQVSKN